MQLFHTLFVETITRQHYLLCKILANEEYLAFDSLQPQPHGSTLGVDKSAN